MLAYFDCFAGISGDMTLGALVDLGVPLPWLEAELKKIPLDGFTLTVHPVVRGGLTARWVQVQCDPGQQPRHWKHIQRLIGCSPLSEGVKTTALKVFGRLAEAEAAVHGIGVDEVHFHEVGAVDAIVDIVGTALGLEFLAITQVAVSPIALGSGTTVCHHGILPVPAPATLAILKGLPVVGGGQPHEMTTPTGAAIVAALAGSHGALPSMRLEKYGCGAGRRDLGAFPNVLRIIVGKHDANPPLSADAAMMVEATIDDMSGQWFGFAMERLFDAGALDVWWVPVQMKKNRPGTMVQVLCPEDRLQPVVHCLLAETTSIGVRFYPVRRTLLERHVVTRDSPFGPVLVKQVKQTDGTWRLVPEYEACRRIALDRNLPLQKVFHMLAVCLGS
jgi:hypothetical protein